MPGSRTARAQRLEFLLQRPQFADPLCDVADVFVEQRVDLAAILRRRLAQRDQCPDLVECHVQVAALADEGEPFQMGRQVHAVVVVCAQGWRQQAFALVETDGLDRRSGRFGQGADLHGFTSCPDWREGSA
jgi:hypothetical protein